jgi:hypothetical protein
MSRQRSIIPLRISMVSATIENRQVESRINRHEARAAHLFKKLGSGAVDTESARVFHLGGVPMQRQAHGLFPVSIQQRPDGSYHEVRDDSNPYSSPHPGQRRIDMSVLEAIEGIGRAAEMYDIASDRFLKFTTDVTFLTPDGSVSVDSRYPIAPLTATSVVLHAFLSSPSAPVIHPDSALLPL